MIIERIDPKNSLQDLVVLARVEYGESEIADPDYLRWQYLENPAGEAVVVVAHADTGELAGQYVVIPLEFRIEGKVVKGSLSLNTLTHPNYRGMGLFTKMANQAYAICEEEGLALTLGFPNKNSYPGFVRKLNFQHIGNASVMFRPLRPLRLLAALPKAPSAPKYAKSELEAGSNEELHLEVGPFEIKSLDYEAEGASYDRMTENQVEPRCSVHKNAAFCAWRFQSIPTRDYYSFQARNSNGIQAACVVRQRRVKGVECVFIVDLQMTSSEVGEAAGVSLLKGMLGHYRAKGVSLAGLMVIQGATADRVARSMWFREMPSRLLPHDAPIIVRRNGSSVRESVFNIEGWGFAFGDYDVF